MSLKLTESKPIKLNPVELLNRAFSKLDKDTSISDIDKDKIKEQANVIIDELSDTFIGAMYNLPFDDDPNCLDLDPSCLELFFQKGVHVFIEPGGHIHIINTNIPFPGDELTSDVPKAINAIKNSTNTL